MREPLYGANLQGNYLHQLHVCFPCPSSKLPVGSQDYSCTVPVPQLEENIIPNSIVIKIELKYPAKIKINIYWVPTMCQSLSH